MSDTFPSESDLRAGRKLVGTPVLMQDGDRWVIPPMPSWGASSDELIRLLINYEAAGESMRDLVVEQEELKQKGGKVEDQGGTRFRAMKAVIGAGFDLALAALQLNYPDVTKEHAGQLLARAQVTACRDIIVGESEIADLIGFGPAGNGR